MIAYLTGRLESKELTPAPATVILDVNGVGYELFIPLSTFDALPRCGTENCRLYICEHIREDAHLLFGFSSPAEKNLFLLLQSVSGVGPKLALSALSGMSLRALKQAIVDGDSKTLSKISGIGKRTAERIVVELRGKINPLEAFSASGDLPEKETLSPAFSDAVLALTALGKSQEFALQAVRKIAAEQGTEKLSTEQIIRAALSAPAS